jgi:anti-sigma factor RsiW
MNCPIEMGNSEMLVAYAAGELDPEANAALERHLDACPRCRLLAGEQAELWKTLDAWEAPPVSPDFDRRLYRRIREEVRPSWWERLSRPFHPMPLRQLLPLTATLCLLLMASLLVRHPAALHKAEPRAEAVRVEQVESTLDDLELLNQFVPGKGDSAHSGTM